MRHELGLSGTARVEDILLAAKRIGLRAKTGGIDLQRAAAGKAPLPCILETHVAAAPDGNIRHTGAAATPNTAAAALDGRGAAPVLAPAPVPAQPAFIILARFEGESDSAQALIHDPAEARPQSVRMAELQHRLTGRAIFITSRAQLAAELTRFDFTWFVPAIVKYQRLLGEALLASLFIQIFGLLTPLFFQVVMDKVLVHKGISTLTVLAIGLTAVVIFESLLSALRNYVFSHTTSRIDVELGAQLFRHLLNLPLAYFEARRVGDSVARVRELENIRQFLTGHALTSIIDFGFTFVFLAVMLYYSPLLTLVVVISIPCYIILMALAMPAFRRRLDEKFARGAENQSFLVEAVTNIQTLKAGATEPQAVKRWDEQLAAYVAASFRVNRLATWAGEAIQLIQKLVTVGIMWLGAYEVIDGAMTVGALVAFNMLAGRVSQPVIRLAQLWQELQQTGISVARLGDILNTKTESVAGSRTQLPPIKGQIEFDQVRFRYRPDGSEVLRGVSFALKPGEVLGLVGRSGSGKSTVAKLVQRL